MTGWRGHDDQCNCFGCRVRSIQFAGTGLSDKETDRQLRQYQRARAEGIQPMGTGRDPNTGYLHSEVAMEVSEQLGRPYRADDLAATYYPEQAAAVKEWTEQEKGAILESLQ